MIWGLMQENKVQKDFVTKYSRYAFRDELYFLLCTV